MMEFWHNNNDSYDKNDWTRLSKIWILYLAVHPRLQIELNVLLFLYFSSYFLVLAFEPSAYLRE